MFGPWCFRAAFGFHSLSKAASLVQPAQTEWVRTPVIPAVIAPPLECNPSWMASDILRSPAQYSSALSSPLHHHFRQRLLWSFLISRCHSLLNLPTKMSVLRSFLPDHLLALCLCGNSMKNRARRAVSPQRWPSRNHRHHPHRWSSGWKCCAAYASLAAHGFLYWDPPGKMRSIHRSSSYASSWWVCQFVSCWLP